MEKGLPLVSIMMPVYNGAQTLPLALDSLLAQTYENWKCFIVNDGSTDATRTYLDSLKDERFVVVHLPKNMGRPYARQTALDTAEGEYIAFLDADDFYHPEKLSKQVKILQNYLEVVLTCCGNASYNEKYKLETVRGKGTGKPTRFKIGDRQNVVLRTAMIRLEEARKYQFNPRLNMAEDMDFTDRLLHQKVFLTSNEVLYYYSEFVSVTGKKILETYGYGVIYHLGLLKYGVLVNLKSVLVTLLKFLITAVLLPFTGVNYFLRKRGVFATDADCLEFASVKDLLNIKYQ